MPTTNTDTPMPLEMPWPESKNNTINYLGELFETLMGELLNSISRDRGAGFDSADASRALKFLDEAIRPIFTVPAQDTPVLAAVTYGPEDKPGSVTLHKGVDGKFVSKKR